MTIAVDSDNTILVPRSLNAKESDHAAIAQKIKDFYSPYLNFTGNWRSLIKVNVFMWYIFFAILLSILLLRGTD